MYTGYGSVPGGTPVGIVEGPPPDDLADIYGIAIGNSNAAKAAHWISQRFHELNTVADRVRILPPP